MAIGTLLTTIFPMLDDDGQPLAGGKLSFYEAGTLVAKPVYHDADLGSAWTQPVELDSEGSATIFTATGSYDITVTDADDVQIDRLCITGYQNVAETQLEDFSAFSIGAIRTVTTDTTVQATDRLILCDTTGGALTVTLRAAASYSAVLILKNIGPSLVTIQPAGSDTLDGSTSANTIMLDPVTGFQKVCQLASDGVSAYWAIVGSTA